jgi:RNA polymerase sigma-70 factor, ECF subfamily
LSVWFTVEGVVKRREESRIPERASELTPVFEDFYLCEYPKMVALAYGLSGNRLTAEDLAQEALLRAYRRWDRVGRYDKPGAWTRRVVLNLVATRHRRALVEAKSLLLFTAGQRRLLPRAADEVEALWMAVRALPRRQREVVALYYLGGHSVNEIATIVEAAEGTVKTHLHRARTSLRTSLSEFPNPDVEDET